MTDIQQLFARQAAWQQSRENLTWEEKVRMAEAALPGLREWRAAGTPTAAPAKEALSAKPQPPIVQPAVTEN
ncbi:hypothetical protein LBMAG56_00550 [Verrucomicrobiota bacterium]|nr:hypothetical protein LBMAG56_00550 [Verrucomicrobiota bacterium]